MIKSSSLKRFLVAISIMGLTLSVVGCSSSNENKDKVSESKVEQSNFTPVEFTYSDGAKDYNVKVETPREKAVTLSQFMTEMLLALDLGDKMVGTALLDNPILGSTIPEDDYSGYYTFQSNSNFVLFSFCNSDF